MKRINVVSCQAVKERSLMYEYKKITGVEDAYNLLRDFIGINADREYCVIACLDTKHNVTALHTVSVGTLDSAVVHPREVFKVAILSNSAGIICAHNHPSGDPSPSKNDIEVTKRLNACGKILGISLVDSLIIGDNTYISLKEKGVI